MATTALAIRRPRVFSIPPSAPFLPALVGAIRSGLLVPFDADDPLAAADVTIWLPTRRAARRLAEVWVEAAGGAAILPRIRTLGDAADDDPEMTSTDDPEDVDPFLAMPPAVSDLDRRLALADLVRAFAGALATAGSPPLLAATPAQALSLAGDLAALFDSMRRAGIPFEALGGIVPERFDRWWQATLRFVAIAGEAWPARLAELGRSDPVARRDAALRAIASRVSAGEGGPVIAAGSTGSVPATAELLSAIARRADGAVVLPGLDLACDDATWDAIGDVATTPGHPQAGMRQLVGMIGVPRVEIVELGRACEAVRDRLVSEALRPAAVTDAWVDRSTRLPDPEVGAALAGVALAETATEGEEALVAAVALREAIEAPGVTAAMVTPDRNLARRVVANLARWNIAVDDSGGAPLPDTGPGRLLGLVAACIATDFAPVPLSALLDHPAVRLGLSRPAFAETRAVLELLALRGPRPRPGPEGLRAALSSVTLHPADPRNRLVSDARHASAVDLVARIERAFAPLTAHSGERSLALIAAAMRQTLAALRDGPDPRTEEPAELEALERFLDDLVASGGSWMLGRQDIEPVLTTLAAERQVRRAAPPGARVRILGTFEARLLDADRVVLAGLVEGVWPPQTRSDPFLSRPMRLELGLEPPERRIGLAAHDFAGLMGMPDVVLVAAAKRGGVPTVLSRFVQRLGVAAGDEALAGMRGRGERLVALARALDAVDRPVTTKRPDPKPPVAARPRRFSVSDVEDLIRDPYTIYARRVLGLAPLPALDTPIGASDRGTLIHRVLADFVRACPPGPLPPDPLPMLVDIGRRVFGPLLDEPDVAALWWPRFLRIARWFVGFEAHRRATVIASHVEHRGTMSLGPFEITARADRIDVHADGRVTILDYKTGDRPTRRQVQTGIAPQLPLEGAILLAGGFPGLPAGPLAALGFVKLKGGESPGVWDPVEPTRADELDAAALADRDREGLARLLARFDDPTHGYPALVRPMWSGRYGAYDHLARVQEWSAAAPEDEEGSGA